MGNGCAPADAAPPTAFHNSHPCGDPLGTHIGQLSRNHAARADGSSIWVVYVRQQLQHPPQPSTTAIPAAQQVTRWGRPLVSLNA